MSHRLIVFFICLLFILWVYPAESYAIQDNLINILPIKERASLFNNILKWRLENILPQVMRRYGIDMWLVINREYMEDPVYLTLIPQPVFSARRTSILIFHDQGGEKGVERLSASFSGMDDWYRCVWLDKSKKQFENLAEVIKKINPAKIGINISPTWAFADGLTASLLEKLKAALGEPLSSRLIPAEGVCLGWLETRSPMELSLYKYLAAVAHQILGEFFSTRVIIPDVTSREEVEWWISQRINDLGLETWFPPSITIQRKQGKNHVLTDNIIRRGDLLHCDFGIKYVGLCTDMQWQAYVCRINEDDAPEGLKKALAKANRLAEILMAEFKTGLTGNEIVKTAMKKGEDEGLHPLIYSHPIGFHGHAAGPPMEARRPQDAPEGSDIQGAYPLFANTAYAIEFSVQSSIPEWNQQDVHIGYEETAFFDGKKCFFVDGFQKQFMLIK